MSRPEIITWVEENTGITECSFYSSLTDGAYYAAFGSALSGQFWLTGGLALVGKAAEITAEMAGCNKPPPPPISPGVGVDCWEVEGYGKMETYNPLVPGWGWAGHYAEKVIRVTRTGPGNNPGYSNFEVVFIDPNGATVGLPFNERYGDTLRVRIIDAPCVGTEPEPPVPPFEPGTPIADPVTHTDSQGCNWTIQASDAYIDDAGVWHTYYTITADNDACGGPFAYWSSGEKPPEFVTPTPDDPQGDPQPPAPPPNYTSDNCCKEIQEELDKIKEELDAVKQCACGDPKPELLGDWVSIRFVSDGISPGGTNPLRKLFRYRSQSSRTDEQLREYWAGFTWQAGSVIVKHVGAWWGQPQVWASTAEEAKRVIRFAAGEAGLDADTDGKWVVTGSSAPRYGMPGTMRIQEYRGRLWVTSRLGPSGPVEL